MRLTGIVLAAMAAHLFSMQAAENTSAAERLVYFGTYTSGKSQGIYVAPFNAATGKLGTPELAATARNPSFVALHPNKRFLYAVGETGDGKKSGTVSAFAIDAATGKLLFLNTESSGGGGPCHLSVDAAGRCVLVANYGSGSIAALPILNDGRLGPAGSVVQHRGSSVNPQRQAGPHAHFIAPDPRNRFMLCCDLGLDQVLAYKLVPGKAQLIPNGVPFFAVTPGSGPRHFAFDPKGRFAYIINEMGCTLTATKYDDKKGTFAEVQTVSTLANDFKGKSSCAEVQVHPNGKFVYASNRGEDTIAIFSADTKTGELTASGRVPSGGKTPRHFTLDPTGAWLIAEHQDSNNITVFAVDKVTGALSSTGQSLELGAPVCAVFLR
jgi:6-phosphogluconolactonase